MRRTVASMVTLIFLSCSSPQEEQYIDIEPVNNNQIIINLPTIQVGNKEAQLGTRYIVDIYWVDSTKTWKAILRELGHDQY